MHLPRALASTALLLLAAASMHVVRVPAARGEASAKPVPAEEIDGKVLRGLDARFGTSGVIPAASADRAARYRAFVRDRLGQEGFYKKTLSHMFRILTHRYALGQVKPFALTLQTTKDGDREIYYVDTPCKRAETVRVQPWWDLGSTVWICNKDYRPDVVVDTSLGQPRFCEYSGQVGHTHGERACRCGQHLVNCARDRRMQEDFYEAYFDEVIATARHVIQHDQPFSRVITMNETVRNDYADFFYARSKYFATGKLDYPKPDPAKPPALRARDSHFDGGVLATYQTIYNGADSHRSTIWQLWEAFLCKPLSSSNVDAHQMFNFEGDTGQLRTAERIELTERTGCQDCHRVLEYAQRPLVRGYPSQWQGQRYTPHKIADTKLFVGLEDTPRASGPATLGWLGSAMAAQPEFPACIVSKTEALVWGGLPVPEDVHAHLVKTFTKAQSFAALLEAAVVARYVGLDAAKAETK